MHGSVRQVSKCTPAGAGVVGVAGPLLFVKDWPGAAGPLLFVNDWPGEAGPLLFVKLWPAPPWLLLVKVPDPMLLLVKSFSLRPAEKYRAFGASSRYQYSGNGRVKASHMFAARAQP